MISSVNVGPHRQHEQDATGERYGVAVQRLGARHQDVKIWGDEPVHFDCPSGDQNRRHTANRRPFGNLRTRHPDHVIEERCSAPTFIVNPPGMVTFDGNYSVPQA